MLCLIIQPCFRPFVLRDEKIQNSKFKINSKSFLQFIVLSFYAYCIYSPFRSSLKRAGEEEGG